MTAQKPRPATGSFPGLVDQALTHLNEHRRTARYALDLGIRPQEIIDYVRGHLSPAERRGLTSLLGRSSWAMSRVVALVKSRRNSASLGAKILASDHIAPSAWGMKETGDEDADLCLLLDRVG